ncbi:Collagen triple helix repeat-containing protein, partial [Reichenbachiella faecimaris]
MKKFLSFSFLLIILTSIVWAQSPNAFKYQAIARDGSGDPMVNQEVNFQISLLQGSASGTTVYSETHLVNTNGYGLVGMDIGSGNTISGTFSAIDWSAGPYFIQVAIDTNGGSSFQTLGTTQMLSVPYALYAETSGSSLPGPQGDTGPQGPAGADGSDGQDGATGPQGATGEQGAQGETGADGQDGEDGQSAYELWLADGNEGTEEEFLASLKGAKGDKGDKGDMGDIGPAGPTG